MERRALIGAALAAPVLLGSGEGADRLTLYSPAPPGNPMHRLNEQFGASLAAAMPAPRVVPVALPDSVNRLAPLPADRRARHWPIVTTADFLLARHGRGPAWHAYPRACPDLYFVSRLYDVGVGISVWHDDICGAADLAGLRVAVPPRPSAVRLLAEALLSDGWGLAGKLTLVDMAPGGVAPAIAAGAVDATVWNLVVPGGAPSGMLGDVLPRTARFLPVDADAFDRIHAAHDFRVKPTAPAADRPPLIAFTQAIAAWDESDARTVRAMLDQIAAGTALPGFPTAPEAMRDWPALDEAAIHPAARDWYRARGAS